MKEVVVSIDRRESQWGMDIAVLSVPKNVIQGMVYDKMSEAYEAIKEEGIPEDWSTPEINDEILSRAAESLGATWHYVSHVEYYYA